MSNKVFISYSHDSDGHREKVLALSERLRADGIETLLDRYVNGTPSEGWPRWMLDQLDAATFVLVVCTETYYRRFRGHEEPGKGKGVDWEGALITIELYNARSRTLKFVPVFLSEAVEEHIPEPLPGLRSGPESAQSDLDEAWEIAARGPMPLFLADIHLYRARLFFREAHYPFTDPDGTPRTAQQDLADARKIITKITSFQRPDGVIESHSYLRRKEELEDAEAAIRP